MTASLGAHDGGDVSLGWITQIRLARDPVVAGAVAAAYGGTSKKGNIDV
jgi:hypothetical protein